ncbi:MAG: hypothetical protein ACLFTR_04915 [Candidatus Woesearchaeota archaeon]
MDIEYQQTKPPDPMIMRLMVFIPIIGWLIKAAYNLWKYHHPMPHGLGGGTILVLTGLTLFAAVLFMLPIFYSMGGTQGVIAGMQNIFTGAKETTDAGMDEYSQTIQRAMGTSYASEVDQHADKDIGIFLEDVEPTRSRYSSRDPVTVWGVISGDAPGEDRIIDASMSCRYESPERDSSSVEGFLSPSDNYIIDEKMSRTFRCEFPAGTIDGDSTGSHRVELSSEFSFETMAYFTIPFMDEEAYLALRRSDPGRLTDIQNKFTAQNTYSPVEVGVGAQDFPILVSSRGDSHATLGFSINDRWDGAIEELKSFTIMMPEGVVLEDCDSPIDFVADDEQQDEFFTNYTMVDEGIEHLSARLEPESFSERFEPQSFQCFLSFDPESLFAERSRLDPIELNIFPHITFDYSMRERLNLNVRDSTQDFRVTIKPSLISLNSKPSIEVTSRSKDIDSATLTLRHRKADELSSEVVPDYEEFPMQRTSDGFGYTFRDSLEEISDDIERGDVVLFRVDAVTDGESDFDMISRTIDNNPPELTDEGLYFGSLEQDDDRLTCYAEALDEDGDDLETPVFTFRNRNQDEENDVSGACDSDEDGHWSCSASMDLEEFDDGDIVECSVVLYDGIDYNTVQKREETTIEDLQDASEEDSEDEEQECESDGDDIRVRGSSTGLMEVDGETEFREELRDRCLDEDTLREYYCDDQTNRIVYEDIECGDGCFDGVCVW